MVTMRMTRLVTPKDIDRITFTTTSTLIHDWYDADEVDAFLECVATTLNTLHDYASRNDVTPSMMRGSDVDAAEFRYRGNWYRADDVDDFLDRCADDVFCLGNICLSLTGSSESTANMLKAA